MYINERVYGLISHEHWPLKLLIALLFGIVLEFTIFVYVFTSNAFMFVKK